MLVLFSDAFVERSNVSGTNAGTSAPTTRDHLRRKLAVALVVPAALALYWTACKSADADMIPALALSGLGGGALAIVVVFASVPSDRDPDESPESPFMPNPPDADGGVALAALLTQTVSVALAFALLTVGAKRFRARRSR